MIENFRPRLKSVIRRGFSRREEYGLHVTIGALFTLLFMGLFFSIMEDLSDQDLLFRLDYSVHTFFDMHRTPRLTTIAVIFTTLGNFSIVTLGMICISVYLYIMGHWYRLSALAVSVTGGALALSLMKLIIHRPRPPFTDAMTIAKTFSFPSGHSFAAFSFYAVLAWIICREGKSIIIRSTAVVLGLVIVLGIGLSRIYLGVHWPSDVLGGYTAGAAMFIILVTALEIWTDYPRPPLMEKTGRRILAASLFLIWVCGVGYSVYSFPFRETAHLGGYARPVTLVRMEYIQSRQVANSVFMSAPPKMQFEGLLGNSTIPSRMPEELNT